VLLQNPANHPHEPRHPDFRNPDGVARKTQNIATVHPAYHGAPSNGNRLDKEVLDDFLDDPTRMHAMAGRIRELLAGGKVSADAPVDLDMDDTPFGKVVLLFVLTSAASVTRSSAVRRSRILKCAAFR
jgi:5-methylcytosine-specific restriction protein A